ncbi:HD domain-containing protein [Roseivivax sp. THAF30]|uniref:HD domain-containing protein n=1 Tax=Roseivivax sp. THAF30 TaxID=2587852 RepID=UPI0015628E7A|nr:HD domain-containing protein [Roseivivax sp. THAF30]
MLTWGSDYAPCDAYRSDTCHYFRDSIVSSLVSLAPVRRLAGIGFLGAIDHLRQGSGRAGHRRRHNRLEHSLGVARLADVYAREADLSDDRRRLLLTAALLHDVGHGPLSHTLEPVFSDAFGIDHHSVTRDLITGKLPAGEGIAETLAAAQVDIEEVLALIDGTHDGDVGFLFSSQINLDTLDGITRCRAFVAPRPAYRGAERIARLWARGGALTVDAFDEFWRLKHDVYTLFIGGPSGAALDMLAQTYMREHLSEFAPEDFLITETTLLRRHPELHDYLKMAARLDNLRARVPKAWLKQTVERRRRDFFVEADMPLVDNAAIDRRYKQTKTRNSTTLAELLD